MKDSIPEILKEAAVNHAWRMINLTERALLGPLTPQVRTPWRAAFMWERSTLYHYTPVRETKGPPLLIIPPLMVDPSIFDLRAGHSFVSYLMEQGRDVYLIDLGVPDKTFKSISLDDYIFDFVEPAFDKVLDLSGAKNLFLFGWSMGGIMSYIYSSLISDPSKIAGVITAGSPVDFSKLFPFHILAKIFNLPLTGLLDVMGNVPSPLIRLSFRLISPFAYVMRFGELFANYHDREWVAAYESIDDWVDGLLPYAHDTFKQFFQECIIEDKLRKGNMTIGDRIVNLKKLVAPLLVIFGTTDKLAPPDSVEPIVDLVGSKETETISVAMGHIGMVAGRRAPEQVWNPIANWIERHI